VGRAHDVVDHDVLDSPVVERAEEVADVEDADDVVQRVAVHGVARVGRVDHRRERLLGRKLDREGDHLGPRHHHVVGFLVGEVEDLVEHLLLRLLDLLRLRDDQADVLFRVHGQAGGRGLDAEQARNGVGRLLEHPHQRIRDPAQPVERDGEPDGHALRPLQRDRLRHQLAEDDAQVGQDEEREDERDAARHPVVEEARQEGLPQCTQQDPEDGDPDLDGGDEANGLVEQTERRPRPPVAAPRQLLEPGPPRRDERVLGGDEDRIPQNEQENDDDTEGIAHGLAGP
jgi:hypothetical protein